MKIFPELESIDLTEYAANSTPEQYTGIVLDPEDQIFKTVTGSFHDKKEFYDKLGDRGYVVRKVFEKRVFDWIEENAKTTLEAYLMFSTAFSKWKGNNLLDQYYVKLLNDIPQLNREKIKGNPNSVGDQQKEESVLQEDIPALDYIPGQDNWPKHTITVIPLDSEGKEDIENSLVLKDIKFDNVQLKIADAQRKLYDGHNQKIKLTFKNSINKALQSSSAFISAFGEVLHPRNRDEKIQFYNPEYDTRSKLYIPNSGKNPEYFHIKIDDNLLLDIDNKTPFLLPKTAILNWYDNAAVNNHSYNPANPQFVNAISKDLQVQKTDDALLNAAADLEKSAEIMDDAEKSQQAFKSIFKRLFLANPKYLATTLNYKNYVSEEEHNKVLEFIRDKQNFVANNITPEEKQKLFKKYGAENQREAINNLAKQEKEFYEEIANKQVDTKQDKIKWLKQYIEDMGHSLNSVDKNYVALVKLNKALEKLKHFKIKKPKDLQTNYTYPDSIPADLSRTGYINQPKGVKAKHTITQDDLGIGKGIHSLNKSESTWNSIINTIKEDFIPKVDDIQPIKHVNYGADTSYAEIPVDGVISNPGSVFKTGGTFISEEEDNPEQWDNRAHDDLNQDLFEEMHLRPEVREALLRIATKFKSSLGLNIEPVDVYFTGSSANFNYNELSDIDLHLVYDFEEIGINAEILIKYFIAKKQVFNNNYEISIKGIPVEVGVENLNEPIVSTAIYSVVKDQWMLKPTDAAHLLPKPDMKQYYEIVQKIEDAIESRDSKKIGTLWDELYRIRKDSLATDGEYGHGNGLFKKLRNLGYLDRLKHAYYSSASEELSLEALKEII